jgi:hypothetical protein
MHGYRLSSKQSHSGIDFGRCVKENAPSTHDVVNSGSSMTRFHPFFGHFSEILVKLRRFPFC